LHRLGLKRFSRSNARLVFERCFGKNN